MFRAIVIQVSPNLLYCQLLLLFLDLLLDPYCFNVQLLNHVMNSVQFDRPPYNRCKRSFSFFVVSVSQIQVIDILVQQRLEKVIFRVDQRLECPLRLRQMPFGQLVHVVHVVLVNLCNRKVSNLLNPCKRLPIRSFLHLLEAQVLSSYLELVQALGN